MKYNYIDLFHGIGGFALGAYWAGMKFENHFCSDIEPYVQELYKLRFPDSIQLGDITKINTDELKKYGKNWIISGGFPCQDISIAGKGEGIHGKRSGLWFEYWRLINDLRPRFAIMENVGMLIHRGLREVLGSLTEIGYDAEWQDIRAEDMGAPHKRERIWIVSYPESYTIKLDKSRVRGYSGRTGEISGGSTNEKISDTSLHYVQREQQRDDDKKKREKQRNGQTGFCSGKNNWSIEPSMGRLAHGIPRRVDRLKGLGNSIVPQIAEILFRQIKPNLENE